MILKRLLFIACLLLPSAAMAGSNAYVLGGGVAAGAYVYGVKWDTSSNSPTLTKGYLVGKVWTAGNHASIPVQAAMKRCVIQADGDFDYYLDASNSIYKSGQTTPTTSGTTTSASASHLVDSGNTFSTVVAGMWAHNTASGWSSLIKSVASGNLTLADDIFPTSTAYSIGTANPMADGAVYVEVPKFYYVWVEDGTDTYFLVSTAAFDFTKPVGATDVSAAVHPWFGEGGAGDAAYKYFSAFESVWYSTSAGAYSDHNGSTAGVNGDKAVSLPGYKPLTYQYRKSTNAYENYNGLHAAFGSNHHTQSFYAYEAIWLLMTVEYASLNGQSSLPGYTEASSFAYAATRRTGRTMLLGNVSGSIEPSLAAGQIDNDAATSYGIAAGEKVANSYRGIENIYGHIWKWIDGININFTASEGRIYLSNTPSQWAEDTATNYTDTGLGFPLSDGYASALHPGRLLTKSVAGNSSTYLCDYFFHPGASAGWKGLMAGGTMAHSDEAGPAYVYTYSGRYELIGGRAAK